MASSQATPRPVNPVDRLGLTLFLAITLHALLILGVGFTPEQHRKRLSPQLSMEITLVHSHDEPPDKPDYLAQASQQGGGNVEEKVRAASAFPNPLTESQTGEAPEARPEQRPEPAPQSQAVMTTPSPAQLKAEPRTSKARPDTGSPPNAMEVLARARAVAQATAEVREHAQAYAQRPRKKTVSANTREYAPAAYMEGWRMKVERVGNLNYPDEAKRQNLSGSLILAVTIAADGHIIAAEVTRSSGHKVLDDAALRIVRMAAPYAPLPESLRREADQLEIVRTWQFEDNTPQVR